VSARIESALERRSCLGTFNHVKIIVLVLEARR